MLQLSELFSTQDGGVSRDLGGVNRACAEYVRLHSQEFSSGEGQEQLMQSIGAQFSPSKLKIAPELLSPEETA